MSSICEYHLCNLPVNKGGRFCSHKCKSKFNVDRRRKDLKALSIRYKGGKCYVCSYDLCVGALDFHHLDPNKKDFGLSKSGNTRSWEQIKAELDKCILLCCRCHRECHSGFHSDVLTKYHEELKIGLHIYALEESETNRQKGKTKIKILQRLIQCTVCNKTFDPGVTKKTICSKACRPKQYAKGKFRKVLIRPSYTELKRMIKETSYSAVGRQYNVSDNAIRKWERAYILESITALAQQVLGESADKFMHQEHSMLDGLTPHQAIQKGKQEDVERILHNIEYSLPA
jgi:predicted nucleic acid-binding Zn ribbon protein